MITDVAMPRISGKQVAEEMRLLHPGVRMLDMSGYTDDGVIRHGVLASEAAFLQKPFTPPALANKIREVLDDKQDAVISPSTRDGDRAPAMLIV